MPEISWGGAGCHEGHIVALAETWPPLVENGVLTCGRVSCSCGESWSVGGWPPEVYELIYSPEPTTHEDGCGLPWDECECPGPADLGAC